MTAHDGAGSVRADARKRDVERRAAERLSSPESPVSTRREGVEALDLAADLWAVRGIPAWPRKGHPALAEAERLIARGWTRAALSAPVPDVAAERVAAIKAELEAAAVAVVETPWEEVGTPVPIPPEDQKTWVRGVDDGINFAAAVLRDRAAALTTDATDGGVSRAATTPDQQAEGGDQ